MTFLHSDFVKKKVELLIILTFVSKGILFFTKITKIPGSSVIHFLHTQGYSVNPLGGPELPVPEVGYM
ncbi:hypothetical protein HAX54_032610, partial [Datura stramonium]|nr:hypothetical protein [Datura stramonium]